MLFGRGMGCGFTLRATTPYEKSEFLYRPYSLYNGLYQNAGPISKQGPFKNDVGILKKINWYFSYIFINYFCNELFLLVQI